MATVKQSQSSGAQRLVARLIMGFDTIANGIGQLLGDTTGDIVLNPERSGREVARAVQLFAQALHEDSNLEIDWLWYAANMTGEAQRRYCLERALRINPDSQLARSALAKLPKQAY